MDGVLSIARTDAEGNTFWSARDLMPLMGTEASIHGRYSTAR